MKLDFEGDLLTVAMVADCLTVTTGKVNKWIKENGLPIVTRPYTAKNGLIFNQRFIRKYELEQWCEKHNVGIQTEISL